ncbi:hypothetical protein ACFQY7_55415 [Actinomadura luteofluorescens]|uniref:hypothetical protein n=1 Tax=Actinomadura luteofluorescens TaxID=46163 RepID=UPI003641614A
MPHRATAHAGADRPRCRGPGHTRPGPPYAGAHLRPVHRAADGRGRGPSPSEDFVPDRTINDAGHREELPGRTVRAEGAPATGDPTADRAYDWLGTTFDFFEAVYRRDSIDGAGLPMVSTVHYGDKYDNAFWNGEQMVYGDGDGVLFTDFTAPSTSPGTSSSTASPSTPRTWSTTASPARSTSPCPTCSARSSSSGTSARPPTGPTGSSGRGCSPRASTASRCAP